MKKLFSLVLCLLTLTSAPMARAQDNIAAVVNDSVITTSDIVARMKLALLSSGLPDTPEVRQHLLPQILRGLIDEQLQLQEAKRLDISVSKAEIDKAMENIGHENHIPTDMRSFVESKGGSPTSLEEQIRAGISWNKVIQRELRPRVEVGDDEIDSAIARIRANSGKKEYLVSEIFLAVDNPKDEDQIKQVAERLIQELHHGANFAAVARQFSQSTGAASGGDIGWIQEEQLPSEISHVIRGMRVGQLEGPVRSSSGFHILGLRDMRTISLGGGKSTEPTLDLRQAFHAAQSPEQREELMKDAQRMHMTINDCAELNDRMAKDFPEWKLNATNGMKLSQSPQWFADRVRDVKVGGSSLPMTTNKGLLVAFVCGRHESADSGADREGIMAGIGTEKLEMQARRLQRDLRRSAYLDIRLGKS